MAIPIPYTKRGGSKNNVFWGAAATSISASTAFTSTDVLTLSPVNNIEINWQNEFLSDWGYQKVYQWILLPQRNPNFPDYNEASSVLFEDYDPITDYFDVSNVSDSNNNPYKFYIFNPKGSVTNLFFQYTT